MSDRTTTAETAADATAAVLMMLAETPVHAGASGGKAALDLPIQRSVQTNWPILNDATIRGGFRQCIKDRVDQFTADEFFGDAMRPGTFVTPDAEVLLFPVASAKGMTAWVTCASALRYFARKLRLFHAALSQPAKVWATDLQVALEQLPAEALVPKDSEIVWAGQGASVIILESDSYDVTVGNGNDPVDQVAAWFAGVLPADNYWRKRIRSHLAILDEAAFTHYVLRKTDVRTRVKIGQGVVEHGPWTEENLPVDTLLYTVVSALVRNGSANGKPAEGPPAEKNARPTLATFLHEFGLTNGETVIQFGGDQSLGRGVLRLRDLANAEKQEA